MKLIALIQFLVCALAFGQSSSTASTATTGTCSPADTRSSSNDRFTITCGIGKEQGEALLEIMNKILESQLDPSAVMGKLDEISSGIQDIQKRTGDRVFTESQVSAMSQVLRRSPGKRLYVVLLADKEANAYGKALVKIFTDSGWKVKINQIGTPAIPAYGIYATADSILLGALADAGLSIRGTGDIPAVPQGMPAVLVGLKPY